MDKPWSAASDNVLEEVKSQKDGLTQAEALKRLAASGPNRLVKPREITLAGVFWEEVREPMILLLLFVAVVYAIWGSARDAITIFIVIFLLVLTEILTEYRAKKAVLALRKLAPPSTPVLRDGMVKRVAASDIAIGDVIILEVGERVPADGRVIESLGLEADESPLTG